MVQGVAHGIFAVIEEQGSTSARRYLYPDATLREREDSLAAHDVVSEPEECGHVRACARRIGQEVARADCARHMTVDVRVHVLPRTVFDHCPAPVDAKGPGSHVMRQEGLQSLEDAALKLLVHKERDDTQALTPAFREANFLHEVHQLAASFPTEHAIHDETRGKGVYVVLHRIGFRSTERHNVSMQGKGRAIA
eukprot:CAMPEP_0171074610 /NCGR_PEP_ID=MMETSP0766_2-20121228/12253_1 /TAXON_ID=439317 /ORGANISM="Gambierdiscus australes, Strain CAWD 149" /LENGTH=193 /DNA_ID=CAMNT_0011531417 /DNA_START=72 /DNA_END=653 /DNA_ORIENTATION=-